VKHILHHHKINVKDCQIQLRVTCDKQLTRSDGQTDRRPAYINNVRSMTDARK